MEQLGSEVIGMAQGILENFGDVHEDSADFTCGNQVISARTCFGPEQAGKTINEDALLAIRCHDGSRITWACAIADGVGTSLLSSVGSRVSTWTALAGLFESANRRSPESQALDAMRSAKDAIRTVADALEEDLRDLRFKPKHLPAPAYRHAIKQLSCLQTTLCLVWCCGRSVFIASVGDSGALLSTNAVPEVPLFFPDVSSSHVKAIGPKLERIELDQWQQISVRRLSLAVFTDGVAKSLVEKYGSQLDEFSLDTFIRTNSAADLLDTLTGSTSEEAADNMSLLVVRAS